jgi:hypothetical protein
MDADAVHADADRAGSFAEVPPGGVDPSLLMVVLLDVVPVRDVGVTHAESIRAPSAFTQRSTAALGRESDACGFSRDSWVSVGHAFDNFHVEGGSALAATVLPTRV